MLTSSSTQYGKFYKCPYSHYLYTYAEGGGLVNTEESEHTLFGSLMHEVIEGLLVGKELPSLLPALAQGCSEIPGLTLDKVPRSQELYWLGSGLAYCASTYLLPLLQAQYAVEAIEQELVVPLKVGGVTTPEEASLLWLTRPDALLRRRSDNATFNCNIKTTGYIKDLQKIYEFSVQMLMEAQAIQLHKGIETGGTVILALNKGQKGRPSKEDRLQGKTEGYRQDSPLTYVWWKNEAPTFQWSKGAVKKGVWEFNSTPEEWFLKLPVDLAKQQVDLSLPITHTGSSSISDVIEDIVTVETLVKTGFCPKNLDACNSYSTFNKPCDYHKWCHGTPQERGENFIPRQANHPLEETIGGDF